MTVVGEISVDRRYYYCDRCKAGCLPFDRWSGLVEGMSTPAARRMLSLAGMSWSFDTASAHLAELCLLKVSNDTIRNVSEEEGAAARQWIAAASPKVAETFRKGRGDREFYTDGVTVNTTEGWRDLRLNVMDKREAGLPATPQNWAARVLPEPSVRIAWASLAACDQQGRAWKRMSRKLGIVDDESFSVLADGQRWIWDQAALCWKKAQWVLDVFHVSQHIHDCAKILFGESSLQMQPWARAQLQSLIENGPVQYLKDLGDLQTVHRKAAEKVDAIASLRRYLEANVDSLWYKQRLAEGRPIGTGLIEGGCKTIVSNRLKLNSARWTPKHAEQIAALRCVDYSGLWSAFWADRAA
jgi:hypothetical protein